MSCREILVRAFQKNYDQLPEPVSGLEDMIIGYGYEATKERCFLVSMNHAISVEGCDTSKLSYAVRVWQLYTGHDINKCNEELEITMDEMMDMIIEMS